MKTIQPGQRARLIEADSAVTVTEGAFKDRFQPVIEPEPHYCQCGRVIIWDKKCLRCLPQVE